ncbi:MAG: hypothetical protein N3E45_05550 [Oscillatoriaceae bacterium SKW80]|nr:hypothetical protein [Oscillatoriaceae bacterium SKW80]
MAIKTTNSNRRVGNRTNKVTSLEQKRLTIIAPATDLKVKELPNTGSLPLWMRSLQNLQQGSKIVTSILVGTCLSVYGSTVYCQQMWKQQFHELENLRRTEEQLIIANETLKHKMAQMAEAPGTGLVPPNPGQIIFLEPAPPRYIPPTPPHPGNKWEDILPNPFGY